MPFTGGNIIYRATCTSTNTLAMHLISNKTIPEGTIVITDHQTKGRGQREKSWISEPYKNLTFSLILYPTWLTTQESFSLNIITTIAIYEILEANIPQGLSVKWPNDIYYQNKKIGGILIENLINKNKIKVSVIGIGLNINQKDFDLPHASSLFLICGHEFNLFNLLSQLTGAIQTKYNELCKEGSHTLTIKYLEKLYWINQRRTFQDKEGFFQGIIQGVDETGRLLVLKENNDLNCYKCQEIKFVE